MKKKAVRAKTPDMEEKSIFRQTGELIGSIGAHLVNAKDSVMDFVSNEVAFARKTTKKIGRKVRNATKKSPLKKAAKKVAKKVKKTTKNIPVKKTVKKAAKATPRKSLKKAAKKSTTRKTG